MEKTPRQYVEQLLIVFSEVKRILKKDGTLWLNLGDSYASGWSCNRVSKVGNGSPSIKERVNKLSGHLKEKDLVGIPWMVAFAMRDELGLYLRSDIIWAKKNCMPESVTDRPTRSHEYIFLFSKSPHYFYDAEAIKEPCIWDVDGTGTAHRKARWKEDNKSMPDGSRAGIRPGGFKDSEKFNGKHSDKQRGHSRRHEGFNGRWDAMEKAEQCQGMRNKRDVWTVAPATYLEAHFATYPPDLIRPCIRAGSRVGDTILDPFSGSGTTGQVAIEEGRKAILCELNCKYIPLIEKRTAVTPGLPLTSTPKSTEAHVNAPTLFDIWKEDAA